jgi:hypothetical protein
MKRKFTIHSNQFMHDLNDCRKDWGELNSNWQLVLVDRKNNKYIEEKQMY